MVRIIVNTKEGKLLQAIFYGTLLSKRNKLVQTDPLDFLFDCESEHPGSTISWKSEKGAIYHRNRQVEKCLQGYLVTKKFFLDWEELIWTSAFNIFFLITNQHSGIFFHGKKVTEQELDDLYYKKHFIPTVSQDCANRQWITISYAN